MPKRYKIGAFAALTGKSIPTLRAWDESGKLPAKRTDRNHRYYIESDLQSAIAIDQAEAKSRDRLDMKILQFKLDTATQLISEVKVALSNTY